MLARTVQLSVSATHFKLRQVLATEVFETIAQLSGVAESDVGACRLLVVYNPRLTRLALATHNHVGAVPPMSILIVANGPASTLEVLDPMTNSALNASPALLAIRIDARTRIERVLASLEPTA